MNDKLQLASVEEVNSDGRVKVKFVIDEQSHDEWLLCNHTMYGDGSDGLHSKLGVGDYVIVGFIDIEETTNKPFVLGKLQTNGDSLEVSENTIIKYNGIKVIFENNKITFESLNAPFSDIDFGGLQLFQFLSGLQCVGNLGLPAPLQPAQITQITNAIANSKKITFGA